MAINLLNMKELPTTLTKEETIHLFKNFTPINREKLILGHLRLAAFEATNTFRFNKFDSNELFEIGIIGLIKAVDNFDVTKDIAFSTFAKKCIDNQIITFISNRKDVVDTISINEPISPYNNIESTLTDNQLFTDEIDNKSFIKVLLNNFSKREQEILIRYFGLFGYEKMREIEIAKMYNITQGGVSYIIIKCLKIMKRKLSFEEKINRLK